MIFLPANYGALVVPEVVAGGGTVIRSIASLDDDGRTFHNDLFSDESTLFGATTLAADAFYRFENITIAQGKTISAAKLTLTSALTVSDTVCNVKIFCNDVDDAVAPTTYQEHYDLVRTTAYREWNNVAAWTAESEYETPDFASAVQEVINRGSWVSGNAIMVLIDDNGSDAWARRRAYDFYEDSGKAAELEIVWTN